MKKSIAIATCVKLPEPDVDEPLLLDALSKRGATVRMLAWDGPEDARSDELVVIRSTWNYFEHVDRFLAWVDRTSAITTAAAVLNPAAIVRANAKKTYLRELEEQRGIAIVPTAWVMRGEKCNVDEIARTKGWNTIVIKPVVSAGSFRTQQFDRSSSSSSAQAFLDELSAERDVMIQQWMPTVDTYGERSLIWIDGELSHAIRKSPRFIGADESVSQGDVPIADDERAFALRVLEPIANDILYARVDTIRDGDTLRLMELELIEPSLFLKQSAHALDRFADAIVRRAQ